MTIRLCIAVLSVLLSDVAIKASEYPNVLLIMVDDLKPTLNCYGDYHAVSPNIDGLASRGMRFDAAYCNQAVCAPSRFTLMLGSHSSSTGLYGLSSNLRRAYPNAVTMPQHFAKYGYRTESMGKVFHIGHGNHGDPDSFIVPHHKEKVIEYVDPASTQGGKLTREEAMFTNKMVTDFNSLPRGAAFESPRAADDVYADGRIADLAATRLAQAKERQAKDGTPFFIAVGFARPHLPFCVPRKYWDLYDPGSLPMPTFTDRPVGAPKCAHKANGGGEIRNYFPVPDKDDPAQIDRQLTRKLIHGYYASVSYVDAQIGKVINAVDRLALNENTIIVLWGDHGFHLGDHGYWTKHTNYEQATRIPILVCAPGVTKAGSVTQQLAESVDLYPTLAELAGLPAPDGPQPMDGVSLVPVLENPDARVRDHAFHVFPMGKFGRAIRTDRYRFVEWKPLRNREQKAEYELYDMQDDPLETKNIAAQSPDLLKSLARTLSQYPEPVGRK